MPGSNSLVMQAMQDTCFDTYSVKTESQYFWCYLQARRPLHSLQKQ